MPDLQVLVRPASPVQDAGSKSCGCCTEVRCKILGSLGWSVEADFGQSGSNSVTSTGSDWMPVHVGAQESPASGSEALHTSYRLAGCTSLVG